MKLGVFQVLFRNRSFEEMLDYIAASGLKAIEIGVGGYVGKPHCDASKLLSDAQALRDFRQQIEARGLEISALSCHGNPLHPNQELATQFHEEFQNAVRLAEQLEVQNVVTFSGCPGESDYSLNPVWVTCPWPDDFSRVVEWQWTEKVIPYWQEQANFLVSHGVRAAIEPHPGFCVYNTETLLRLRDACGESIGANFDPSHLFWQGMDPVECIKTLGRAGALYHFHAKDTAVDGRNTALNGVLDTKSYRNLADRSWVFRTVGYGHGEQMWRDIISALQLVHYDGAISIEHEDGLMSIDEGFQKAVRFLQDLLIDERVKDMWWA
ncbi:sugar phosphate isomerase/epimerase family protein [Alicyclobacillus suci]|uniref:sugar phosphate isomerase/epimerase family protein n=1 Tax=Alicyclobacillus suci TaxID=2816080 RepID=UPI001A8C6119|nr:sugar phosphate isomerase/epimerase [Alicyclobacillus suci]